MNQALLLGLGSVWLIATLAMAMIEFIPQPYNWIISQIALLGMLTWSYKRNNG